MERIRGLELDSMNLNLQMSDISKEIKRQKNKLNTLLDELYINNSQVTLGDNRND